MNEELPQKLKSFQSTKVISAFEAMALKLNYFLILANSKVVGIVMRPAKMINE